MGWNSTVSETSGARGSCSGRAPRAAPAGPSTHCWARARESPSFQKAPPETGSRFLSFPSQHFLSCLQTHSSSAEQPLPALTAQAPRTHSRLPCVLSGQQRGSWRAGGGSRRGEWAGRPLGPSASSSWKDAVELSLTASGRQRTRGFPLCSTTLDKRPPLPDRKAYRDTGGCSSHQRDLSFIKT